MLLGALPVGWNSMYESSFVLSASWLSISSWSWSNGLLLPCWDLRAFSVDGSTYASMFQFSHCILKVRHTVLLPLLSLPPGVSTSKRMYNEQSANSSICLIVRAEKSSTWSRHCKHDGISARPALGRCFEFPWQCSGCDLAICPTVTFHTPPKNMKSNSRSCNPILTLHQEERKDHHHHTSQGMVDLTFGTSPTTAKHGSCAKCCVN